MTRMSGVDSTSDQPRYAELTNVWTIVFRLNVAGVASMTPAKATHPSPAKCTSDKASGSHRATMGHARTSYVVLIELPPAAVTVAPKFDRDRARAITPIA